MARQNRRLSIRFATFRAVLLFLIFWRHGAPAAEPSARNVILMIGDGMGPAHVQLTADYAGRPLVITTLSVQGALRTESASHAVTDSAAAATALACGRKTNNGILGQLPDGTKLVSLAELARDAGRRVGLLTTVAINDATPAAFYAKVRARSSFYEVGLMALASRFDVLGGLTFSDAEGTNHPRRPAVSLWEQVTAAGYTIVRTPAELRACVPGAGRYLIVPERLYTEAGAPYAPAFDPERDITLAQMTSKTLELLENPAGFFLMVEGGAIDRAAHVNDTMGVIAETLSFDEAVAAARAFAESSPGTLLVVTADHETGGLHLRDGYNGDRARALLAQQALSRTALGEWLSGYVKDMEGRPEGEWQVAKHRIAAQLGLSGEALSDLEKSYRRLVEAPPDQRGDMAAALARAVVARRDETLGIQWTTSGHSATLVPLFALGPGAERFAGTQDNTRVFVHIKAVMFPPEP